MLDNKSNKIVGVKQSVKLLKSLQNYANLKIYVAKDAEIGVIKPLIELAKCKQLEVNYVATMKELGQLCEIDVGAAAALILE